jgi:2-aminoethylphosphonate dioxygenase
MLPTEQGRANFERDGFLVARGFFSPAEMAEITRWTKEVTDAPEVPGRQMVYYEDSLTEPGKRVVQRIENFCPFHADLDGLVRSRKRSISRSPAAMASRRTRISRRAGRPMRRCSLPRS